MNLEESVTIWIDGLRAGNEQSAQLWERYFSQLVRIAGAKLPRGVRRDFDEEDIALSAFNSLCSGVKEGKFPRLDDRDNLWSLLVVITARKAMYRMRSAKAQKRGGTGCAICMYDRIVHPHSRRAVGGREECSTRMAVSVAQRETRNSTFDGQHG